MGDRRMLCSQILDSDEFLDLPATARLLYVYLNLAADDRGFVGNPKAIMRKCGASAGDANILLNAKFLLAFPNKSALLIKHWRVHNLIRKDRFKESVYVELLHAMYLDENESYSTNIEHADRPVLTTNCQPNDNQATPQDKLSKDKLSQSNISKGISTGTPPTLPNGEPLPEWMQTGNDNIDSAIAAAVAMRERRMNNEGTN